MEPEIRQERILHRANTSTRVEQAVAHGIDRLEIDVWYANGAFLLCHDRQFGKLVVGKNGTALSNTRLFPFHWIPRFLSLPELLAQEPPPLLLDLKGRWGHDALKDLSRLLEDFMRINDFVGSNKHKELDYYRKLDDARALIYSNGFENGGRSLRERFSNGIRIDGTSVGWSEFRKPAFALLFKNYRRRGLRIFVWDIPDRKTYEWLTLQPFDGFIIDDPSWK